jgi:hypothetical protein
MKRNIQRPAKRWTLNNADRNGRTPNNAVLGRRAGLCCDRCGADFALEQETVIKRGAVVVAFDPLVVTWNGTYVPLSTTEAHVFAHLCRRGRTTLDEVEAALLTIGANPATRSLVLGHIRSKFLRIGACDPFERLGRSGLRLRVDPDESGRTTPVVGLTLPRYAVAR